MLAASLKANIVRSMVRYGLNLADCLLLDE
jgi:hypothetical protein